MKITAHTNMLVRAFTGDHIKQSEAAKAALERAELVATQSKKPRNTPIHFRSIEIEIAKEDGRPLI